jgi:hypothetical protein
MNKDFVAEARKGVQQTRTLICLEALRTDGTVKHRHLRKALNVSGRQFRKALRLSRILRQYDTTAL